MRYLAPAYCLIVAASATLVPATLAGQILTGRVMDQSDEQPLNGVQITILDSGPRPVTTVTDANGRFRLRPPAAGSWRIRAELLGYETVVSEAIEVVSGQVVTVAIRMPVDPVEMDEGLVARASQSYGNADIAAFHRRRQWGERSGFGHFLHGEDLENRGPRLTSLLQTVPGVRLGYGRGHGEPVIQMHRGCVPAVYVDGAQINRFNPGESLDNYVPVQSIIGVEIYNGSQGPGMYRDLNGCGSVLVWTDTESQENPFTWFRFAIGVGLILGLLSLM